MAADSDEEYQRQLARGLFAANDEWDDDGHEDISAHTWTCPIGGTSLIYHLAFLAPGHGDSLWNAAACLAQHLLVPDCRSTMLGNEWSMRHWPLTKCIEFGAGAALPSLALLKEGAGKVIITDRFVNDQTFEALRRSVNKNATAWGMSDEEVKERVTILSHTWGEEVERLTQTNDTACEKADLLIASDCIYNPTYHKSLLRSAAGAMGTEGIFLVGYSFHGNVPRSQTLHFFEVAQNEFGLRVVNEFAKQYKGQSGIGSSDEERGAVYVKVLIRANGVR